MTAVCCNIAKGVPAALCEFMPACVCVCVLRHKCSTPVAP